MLLRELIKLDWIFICKEEKFDKMMNRNVFDNWKRNYMLGFKNLLKIFNLNSIIYNFFL